MFDDNIWHQKIQFYIQVKSFTTLKSNTTKAGEISLIGNRIVFFNSILIMN